MSQAICDSRPLEVRKCNLLNLVHLIFIGRFLPSYRNGRGHISSLLDCLEAGYLKPNKQLDKADVKSTWVKRRLRLKRLTFSPYSTDMSMTSQKGKSLKFWVHPEETTKTVEDELDDMFCAPCLTKMLQGTCGRKMESYLRCVYTAYKTNGNFAPCTTPYNAMTECWTTSPKEYARELKKLAESKSGSQSQASPAM